MYCPCSNICIDGIVLGRKGDEREKKGCIAKASDEGREGGRRRKRGGMCKVRQEGSCTGRGHKDGLEEPVMKEGLKKRGRMMVGTKRKLGRQKDCRGWDG
jgi:hypothetical protein